MGFFHLWIIVVVAAGPPVSPAAPAGQDGGAPCGDYEGLCEHGGLLRLALLPEGRFSYDETCAAGSRYDGTWSRDAENLLLEPEYDAMTQAYPKLPVRWRAVAWDERRYLVPEGQIIRLCNAVNLGDEPRAEAEGWPLLRRGDWTRRAFGKPVLPPEWNEFLLSKPIEGRVIAFEEGGFARLDIGENEGLKAGMVLVPHVEGRARCATLKVVCPCEHSARADIISGPDCLTEDAPTADLVIGDRVSTTKAVLTWDVLTSGGFEITFVPEGRPLPLRIEPGRDRPSDLNEKFVVAWALAAPAVADAVTPESVERLGCRQGGRTAPSPLNRERLLSIPLEPAGMARDTNAWVFTHPASSGVPLGKVRAYHRAVCLSAVFDPHAARMERVFVTIARWLEE